MLGGFLPLLSAATFAFETATARRGVLTGSVAQALSILLNSHHEVFGGAVILATIVSMLGAVLLTLSTDMVQSVIPLPEAVVSLPNWQWP